MQGVVVGAGVDVGVGVETEPQADGPQVGCSAPEYPQVTECEPEGQTPSYGGNGAPLYGCT